MVFEKDFLLKPIHSKPKEQLAPRLPRKKRATIQYHANKPFKDFQAAHGLLPWKIVWTFDFYIA